MVRLVEPDGSCWFCVQPWSTQHLLEECAFWEEERLRLYEQVARLWRGSPVTTELLLSLGRCAGVESRVCRRIVLELGVFLASVYGVRVGRVVR